MTLKDLVIKYRADNGLSQRQFALQCGLSNGYISMLEKMSDTAKMECLTFLRLLRENEEMKLLAASSHQTSQPEAK